MNTTSVEPFFVIGLAIRTTNENEQAAKDIPKLWQKFQSENLLAKIPNKTDNTIYCLYTDYEEDYTKPYTTILGCRVNDLTTIPEGLMGKSIAGGLYTTFTVRGKLSDGIVIREWTKIWNSNLQRAYTCDFEVYGEKAQNPDNAEIDIFIAVG
jgi:predicted transcriptional regulator YdeE